MEAQGSQEIHPTPSSSPTTVPYFDGSLEEQAYFALNSLNTRREKGKSKQSAPSPYTFDTLEDQTFYALYTLRMLQRVLDSHHSTDAVFEDEDFFAMSSLVYHAQLFLEPLDLPGVAGALATKKFTIVHDTKSRRPTIACTRCSQEQAA